MVRSSSAMVASRWRHTCQRCVCGVRWLDDSWRAAMNAGWSFLLIIHFAYSSSHAEHHTVVLGAFAQGHELKSRFWYIRCHCHHLLDCPQFLCLSRAMPFCLSVLRSIAAVKRAAAVLFSIYRPTVCLEFSALCTVKQPNHCSLALFLCCSSPPHLGRPTTCLLPS